jgi:hypothetical protein
MALNDKKLPAGLRADEAIVSEIKACLGEDGTLSCPAAFALAKSRNIAVLDIGRAADASGIHLSRCQLGLFGFPGHAKGWEKTAAWSQAPLPLGFEDAVRAALDASGRLSCQSLWRVADEAGVSRIQAGWVADRLGFRIVDCRLGAF